eukprot:scaffold71976_cov55-Attheya_sp.AAC.1
MAEELKPGQKYPTPTPGFGDRVFYETLYRQRPESNMAQEWCVYDRHNFPFLNGSMDGSIQLHDVQQKGENDCRMLKCVNYGVLPTEEAAKMYKKVLKRKQNKGGTTSSSTTSGSAKKVKKSKSKRVLDDVGYDADMQLGGAEGMGSKAL